MDQDLIKKDYDNLVPFHKQLETNFKDALLGFLKDHKISYHTITSRIKEKDSYLDKVERKDYKDHRNQIEDLCGIRIICYYPEDLEKIGELIKKEFNVIEFLNKSDQLEPDRFGYRSDHYIVTVKDEWTKAPNYRNLKNLKAEIQVRTVLMHAWADIEHKLAYKSKDQIPEQFRRQLYQLSALLEIADAQFQSLKLERDRLKESLTIETSSKGKIFDINQELNLDTLQGFLDFYYPDRQKLSTHTSSLFEELKRLNISFKELDNYVKDFDNSKIDAENNLELTTNFLAQVGMIRFVLDIFDDAYWEDRKTKMITIEKWVPTINDIRNKLNA